MSFEATIDGVTHRWIIRKSKGSEGLPTLTPDADAVDIQLWQEIEAGKTLVSLGHVARAALPALRDALDAVLKEEAKP